MPLLFTRPEAFPGELKVKDLCRYNAKSTGLTRQETIALLEKPEIKSLARKKFKQLEDNEDFEAVLALTYFTKADIYLIFDLATGYDSEFAIKLKDRMTKLNEESVVIFITTTDLNLHRDFKIYDKGDDWLLIAEAIRNKLKQQQDDKITKTPAETGKREKDEEKG
jgi:ABC-type multidrug transport system ATPase subunit